LKFIVLAELKIKGRDYMNFSYESQGYNTYLVYRLEEDDIIDQVAYNMIINNDIEGILPIAYFQFNNERYFKFNVSSKLNLKQFFVDRVKRDRFIGVLSSITKTAISVEEYMMEPGYFIYDMDYIFVDVSNLSAYLVYLPIIRKEKALDLKGFVKSLMFDLKYDFSDNLDYVAKIITAFNTGQDFTLPDMQRVLADLQKVQTPQANIAAVQNQNIPQPNQNIGAVPNPNIGPVPNQNIGIAPNQNIVMGQNQIAGMVPNQNPAGGANKMPPAVNIPVNAQKPKADAKQANKEKAAEEKGEKRRLFFRKDKKQKETAKQERFEIPGQEQQVLAPSVPVKEEVKDKKPAIQPMKAANPPAAEPAPANNAHFGKTVIIGGSASNNTVMFGAAQQEPIMQNDRPHIIRLKTMEKIYLDRQVFRIGKAKEFADYCISDNKTISRAHASITNNNGKYYIMDLNSLNHTFVNEQMIASNMEVEIKDGDKFRLSDEIFEFHM